MSKNIRIDDDVYAAIMAAKGKLEAKTGKPQSLNAALRSVLGLPKEGKRG